MEGTDQDVVDGRIRMKLLDVDWKGMRLLEDNDFDWKRRRLEGMVIGRVGRDGGWKGR